MVSRDAHNDRFGWRTRRCRSGSLIIEVVVAVALLATAGYALTKLAQSAAALDQQADERLAATLAADNAIEELRGLSVDQVTARASDVADALSESSGCEVEISTEPFSAVNRDAIHIRVDVAAGRSVRVTAHDWRLDPVASASGEATAEAADEKTAGEREDDDE